MGGALVLVTRPLGAPAQPAEGHTLDTCGHADTLPWDPDVEDTGSPFSMSVRVAGAPRALGSSCLGCPVLAGGGAGGSTCLPDSCDLGYPDQNFFVSKLRTLNIKVPTPNSPAFKLSLHQQEHSRDRALRRYWIQSSLTPGTARGAGKTTAEGFPHSSRPAHTADGHGVSGHHPLLLNFTLIASCKLGAFECTQDLAAHWGS